jgi:hypothetical protein
MRSDKYNRITKSATYHSGSATVDHVLSTVINDPEIVKLPGRIIGKIANIRHAAYLEGKSQGLEIIDDCVYVDNVGLIPLSVLNQLRITETSASKIVKSNNPRHAYNWHTIYRDEACTDRVADRLEADGMDVCYYYDTTRSIHYTLNTTEAINV